MPNWSAAFLGRSKKVQIGLWSICKSTERSTDCAFWNNLEIWKFADTDEPDYVLYSRMFLQLSIITGLIGNIFAIVGNGLLCCTRKFKTTVIIQAVASLCLSASAMLIGASGTVFPILFKAPTADLPNQKQINHILTRDYFSVDPRSRPIFEHGLALYLCWASMIIYGIGCSLYIFIACLICTERNSSKVFVRPLSYTTLNEGKTRELPDEPRERVLIASSSNSSSVKETPNNDEINNDSLRKSPQKGSLLSNRYFPKENQIQTSNLNNDNVNFEKLNRAHTLSTIRSKSFMADDNFCDSIARALSLRKQENDYHESPTTDYSTQQDLDEIRDVSYEAEAESEEVESLCPSVASVSIIESSVMDFGQQPCADPFPKRMMQNYYSEHTRASIGIFRLSCDES
ncbi:Oidioi.mRNA.OKI2018_I69.XSR.g15838.t1.cds [Oikopleura dioica]|uniref:Oidioi.mRNA.OKI2018_I69.XSR.g15838.t1.cds n=1 Tax=Oikopleura dioica TaxID=34765 RepID=A0ABN7SJ74_OIKDI|nr:Oidioi.mRNA.OKI2018_I69.XSR.g15838.t1.cds [Oikopleura dioica]